MAPMATSGDGAGRPVQAPDLQLVIDSTPGLIHTSRPDGYLDFFNQTWLRYIGRPLEDLLGWKWTAVIHPNDVEGIVETWRASLASGEPFVYEARVRRADGEYRWMLHHKVALRDERGEIIKWYGSSIDIEDRRQAEEKIREQETELRQVLDLAPQHVAVIGPGQERIFANRAVLNYFGLRLEEWQSRDTETRVHPDDVERLAWGPQGGPPDQYEARFRRYDGKYHWFLVRNNPLRDEQVASVFISRWDTAVAGKVPSQFQNQLGIAIAKRTFKAYRDLLNSDRWQRINNFGARPQRLLWASTGTKDPKASDILYVKALAAPFSVNTMPEAALKAFGDHGEVGGSLRADGGDAEEVLAQFAKAGIDVDALAAQLQDEGAKSFVKSWDELMGVIDMKSAALKKAS
jgi:PAS domain S-box-containing protein